MDAELANCEKPACGEPVYAKGFNLCLMHFNEDRKRRLAAAPSDPPTERNEPMPRSKDSCRVPGCTNAAANRGICTSCYYHAKKAGPRGDKVRAAMLPSKRAPKADRLAGGALDDDENLGRMAGAKALRKQAEDAGISIDDVPRQAIAAEVIQTCRELCQALGVSVIDRPGGGFYALAAGVHHGQLAEVTELAMVYQANITRKAGA